jgi:hypothetical protein
MEIGISNTDPGYPHHVPPGFNARALQSYRLLEQAADSVATHSVPNATAHHEPESTVTQTVRTNTQHQVAVCPVAAFTPQLLIVPSETK